MEIARCNLLISNPYLLLNNIRQENFTPCTSVQQAEISEVVNLHCHPVRGGVDRVAFWNRPALGGGAELGWLQSPFTQIKLCQIAVLIFEVNHHILIKVACDGSLLFADSGTGTDNNNYFYRLLIGACDSSYTVYTRETGKFSYTVEPGS